MKIRLTVIAFLLSIATTGMLSASEIYKWTDEDGVVHYVDRPTGDATEEHIAIRSRPTNPARVQAQVQVQADARNLRAEEEASAPQGPSQEELLAEAREREEQCTKYTARQVEFTNNRRIYRMDENGERIYYDEAEMAVARAELNGLVSKYCD